MRSGVVDPVTVKELLGHQDIRTTRRYAHTKAETKSWAVAQLKHTDKIVTVDASRSNPVT
jgi:site-specific recombinase XerD